MPRAVWFKSPQKVELREEELLPLGEGDIRVRAIASGISAGTEMLVYRGQVPPGLPLDLPTLQGSFGFPIKYGYASVGRVMAGPGEGEVVFVHHPHQTEYVVPASAAIPLVVGRGLVPRQPHRRATMTRPTADPMAERGVFLANLETAVNVMLDAAPRIGEKVLIFGQGVVGLLLTQLAVRVGAKVLAVEPHKLRQRLSAQLGATVVGPKEVHDADIAIEVSGNPAALDQAIRCVAFGGTVVACSWYGAKPVNLDLGGAFHRGRVRIVSSQVSTIDPALTGRWSRERRLDLARDLLGELQLEALITHRFPLEAAQQAYDLIDRKPEETVQVVFRYGEDVR